MLSRCDLDSVVDEVPFKWFKVAYAIRLACFPVFEPEMLFESFLAFFAGCRVSRLCLDAVTY